MGLSFNDPRTREHMKHVPYKVVRGPSGQAWVEDSRGKQYSPSEVASFVLGKVKQTAEDHLKKTVESAVITVPAHFTNEQRQATTDAAEKAGLVVEHIITEPVAAALACGIKRNPTLFAVYDLGGFTFDISIMEFSSGYKLKATKGDLFLGGEQFDTRLLNHFIDVFKQQTGVDISKDNMCRQRLKDTAEKTK